MNLSAVPWDVFYVEPFSETESLDELLADENFSQELADQINQNFVLEVEASHTHSETTGENGSHADSI
jgi:hypothetical protein